MITPIGFDVFGNAILNTINKAQINVDGTDQDFKIYRKWMEGKRIKVYLLLSNTKGILQNFRLLDSVGRVLIANADEVEKTDTNGYLISFQMDMKEATQ